MKRNEFVAPTFDGLPAQPAGEFLHKEVVEILALRLVLHYVCSAILFPFLQEAKNICVAKTSRF